MRGDVTNVGERRGEEGTGEEVRGRESRGEEDGI